MALGKDSGASFLPDRLLTAREAAEMLSVQLSTVRRWTSDRKLPVCHPGGGRAARYRLSDLLKLLEKWSTPAVREKLA